MTDRTTDSAGAGSPAPAESSVPPPETSPGTTTLDAGQSPVDVVAPEARAELDRIRRRWAELPLERAESRMPLLRRLLDDLAPRSSALIADHPRPAAGSGAADVGDPQEVAAVPDLGPAVAADQLTVLVWDAYAAGRGDGIPALLADLRRDLG